MKTKLKKDGRGWLVRFWNKQYDEVAYIRFGLSGLQANIEFPNDWHEHARAWVCLGLGFGVFAFSFPSKRYGEDDHQCQGPTFGFQFCEDLFWLNYGQPTGTRSSPRFTCYMPWTWKHRQHKVLTELESHPYIYTLKNGEVQYRVATINKEHRYWTRYWLPHFKESYSINVNFDNEVGEETGSWKGGCLGCGYEMQPGETPLQTLTRMQSERKF